LLLGLLFASRHRAIDIYKLRMYIYECEVYVRSEDMAKPRINIKRVTATDLRYNLKRYLKAAKAKHVFLIENRRQSAKYLVDKEFLDSLLRERESVLATLEVLTDRELTDRLLKLSRTIDDDVAADRLLTLSEVFGE